MGNDVTSSMKSLIERVVPGASISLFGSRAYGVPDNESDWDILILTRQTVTPQMKKQVHDALFPLSVRIGAFVNFLLVQQNDWVSDRSYYSLQQTIGDRMIKL